MKNYEKLKGVMSMTLPSLPKKYKIVSETFHGDGVSNALNVERVYRVPRYVRINNRADDFYRLDRSVFSGDGIGGVAYALGWGDSECRTFKMMYLVVPNGGRLIYNDESVVSESTPGASVGAI